MSGNVHLLYAPGHLIEPCFKSWKSLLSSKPIPVLVDIFIPGHLVNSVRYSFRRLLIGLAKAALMDWKLTVNRAMSRAMPPAPINTQGEIVV